MRSPAQGPARQRQGDAAGGLEAGRHRRKEADRAVGPVVRQEASLRGGEPARGSGGDVYHQPDGPADEAHAVPGDDQRDRLLALGRASADRAGDQLAGRADGIAVGRGGVRGDGQGLPQNHGTSTNLDTQGPPRRAEGAIGSC